MRLWRRVEYLNNHLIENQTYFSTKSSVVSYPRLSLQMVNSSEICTELFHNPVILHFCGHAFCGYILSVNAADKAAALSSGWQGILLDE